MHSLVFWGSFTQPKKEASLKWLPIAPGVHCHQLPATPCNSANPNVIPENKVSILNRNPWKSPLGTLMTREPQKTYQEQELEMKTLAFKSKLSNWVTQWIPGKSVFGRGGHSWYSNLKSHKDILTPSSPGEPWEPIKFISLYFKTTFIVLI